MLTIILIGVLVQPRGHSTGWTHNRQDERTLLNGVFNPALNRTVFVGTNNDLNGVHARSSRSASRTIWLTLGPSHMRTHRRELLHKQPDRRSNGQSLHTVSRTTTLPETRT